VTLSQRDAVTLNVGLVFFIGGKVDAYNIRGNRLNAKYVVPKEYLVVIFIRATNARSLNVSEKNLHIRVTKGGL
jgi:hypothetical protein